MFARSSKKAKEISLNPLIVNKGDKDKSLQTQIINDIQNKGID